VNRAPSRAQDGKPGEQKELRLELKLLADVGLVGFPNAGKSTLISSISAARPKIADYPFTTLEPNLGVVAYDHDKSFVVADIPGLIEGAHLGHGLGIQFLRHIERTRLLLHLVDVSPAEDRDPVADYKTIEKELAQHNPDLPKKPRIVVATKLDVADAGKLRRLQQWCRQRRIDLIKISSVTGEGLEELKHGIVKKLSSETPGES
jgi:GTP-binding protein